MNEKKSGLDTFVDFLHSVEMNEEGKIGIHSSKESVHRYLEGLREILEQSQRMKKHAWLRKAKVDRARFSEKIDKGLESLKKKFGSRSEIIDAIKGGLLGKGAQLGFQHQFRNKNVEELSDEDLKSILDDQIIIELLEKEEDEN